jgi:hypothetical protein
MMTRALSLTCKSFETSAKKDRQSYASLSALERGIAQQQLKTGLTPHCMAHWARHPCVLVVMQSTDREYYSTGNIRQVWKPRFFQVVITGLMQELAKQPQIE